MDRTATPAAGQNAILILSHPGHGVEQPIARPNEQHDEQERGQVDQHPVTVVIGLIIPLVFR